MSGRLESFSICKLKIESELKWTHKKFSLLWRTLTGNKGPVSSGLLIAKLGRLMGAPVSQVFNGYALVSHVFKEAE